MHKEPAGLEQLVCCEVEQDVYFFKCFVTGITKKLPLLLVVQHLLCLLQQTHCGACLGLQFVVLF